MTCKWCCRSYHPHPMGISRSMGTGLKHAGPRVESQAEVHSGMVRQTRALEAQPPAPAGIRAGVMTSRVRDLLAALEQLLQATKGRVHLESLMAAAVKDLSPAEAQQYVSAAVVIVAKRHVVKKKGSSRAGRK